MPLDDAQAAVRFNTANAHFRAAQWQQALAGYEAALAGQPALQPAALQRARCLVQLGRWQPARDAFAHVLRLNPRHYSAWLEAGHLCRRMGQPTRARQAYQRAIAVDGARHEALLALGRALEDAGDATAAEPVLAQALQAAAGQSPAVLRQAWRHLGQVRLERGDLARALPALRQALAVARADADPRVRRDESAELRLDLAELLLRDGQHEAGLAQLDLAQDSGREPTLARASQLAYHFNHWALAIALSRRNLALHPHSPWTHWNLAQLLADCWQMAEVAPLLRQAEALAPMPGAQALRASMASRSGDADTALALYQALHAAEPEGESRYRASLAMTSLYSDRLGAVQVAQLHRELFAPLGRGARARGSFQRAPLAGRRLRLGIVSGDFHRQHPVDIFMQPVLRELDRSRFELFIYAVGRANDGQTALARQRAEHWREATQLSDLQLAQRIEADGIDLLLDLAGHTAQNRMGLFAQRAAPVQCSYLGYPGSTGVPHMDWLLGDAVVTPPGCEPLYSERIARLPGTVFCYAPEADYPLPDFGPGLAQRPLTFGCFNNVPKLTPRTLRLWARILAALPQARLLLKAPSFGDAGAVAVFRERLAALGVAPERVSYRGPVGLDEMMAEYADVDIALDPVPYNGGTTTLQALWMGVPSVVMAGEHFVSRMGASFMHAAGLDDWVAADDEAYVATAVAQAADRGRLLALKRGLRQRLLARPGWDVRRHTRALEDAFTRMVEEAEAGAEPEPPRR